jgi:AcrR family transcriptional regulator
MSVATNPRASTTGSGRAQILHAALAEFAEKGFDGASTSSIAKRAGVTQPLIHHHFGSKQGLWHAALEDIFDELEAIQLRTFEEVRDLDRWSVVRVLVRQFIVFSARRPELARLMVIESGRAGANFQHLMDHHVRPMVDRFQRILRKAIADGDVRPLDPKLLHFLILGAAGYPSMVRAEAGELFGLDSTTPEFARAYADVMVDVLFRGIAAPASPHKDSISE